VLPSDIGNVGLLKSSESDYKLIAEFRSDVIKESFIKAGKKFNREGGLFSFESLASKIFINQKLTSCQKTLLYNTKEFAKQYNFKFTWIHRSQILLKKDETSKPIYIRSVEDLPSI
jgi:hypothetical protein